MTPAFRPAALLALSLSTALLLSACSSEQGKPLKKGDDKARSEVFAPIKDAALSLEVVTPQSEYFRGDVAPSLTFSLRNVGLRPITIAEWMARESDNIRILYVRCQSRDGVPSSGWKVYEPKTKPPIVRIPLDLNPRNSVLVNVELSFIKDALAEDAKDDESKVFYAIVGELNLKSISAKSKPFVVAFK